MRPQQREWILTNETRNSAYRRLFEVTSLNHNKVQRQGAQVNHEVALGTTKDNQGVCARSGTGRHCNQADQFLTHHCAAPRCDLAALPHPTFPRYISSSFPRHQYPLFTLSQRSCVQLKKQSSPEKSLTLPPQTTSLQLSTHNLPDLAPAPTSFQLRGWTARPPASTSTVHHSPFPHLLNVTLGLLQAVALFYLHIFSFVSLASAQFHLSKNKQKKPSLTPFTPPATTHFSVQLYSKISYPHSWSPLPLLLISCEAIRDSVPTDLHRNPLDTVRWSLLTASPSLIQWLVLRTCLPPFSAVFHTMDHFPLSWSKSFTYWGITFLVLFLFQK